MLNDDVSDDTGTVNMRTKMFRAQRKMKMLIAQAQGWSNLINEIPVN